LYNALIFHSASSENSESEPAEGCTSMISD
jgi:hypothetical protein